MGDSISAIVAKAAAELDASLRSMDRTKAFGRVALEGPVEQGRVLYMDCVTTVRKRIHVPRLAEEAQEAA